MLDTEREDLCRILQIDHLPESLERLYNRVRRFKDTLYPGELTQAEKAIVVAFWELLEDRIADVAEEEIPEEHKPDPRRFPPKPKASKKAKPQPVKPQPVMVGGDDDVMIDPME